MKKVNTGAKVPRKVALAILVSLMDPKKSAKWMPKKTPAMRVLFKFSLLSGACFHTRLIPHKIIAPNPMRQNEIATAGTFSRYRAIMGEVLTENMANKSRNITLIFNLIFPLLH